MSPLVKVILLIFAVIFQRIATKPPNPPPTKADRVLGRKSLFAKANYRVGILMPAVGIGSMMVECAILLALYFGSSPASQALAAICANPLPPLSTISTLSPMFTLALGMLYTGALIRLWCFKALGTLFTYQITIRPDHKLITSGPYAIVRHPSYTGMVLLLTGMALAVLGPHGYVHECGLLSTPVRWVFLGWVMGMGYAMISLLGRGSFEDAALKNEFGVSWETYRRSVPCRFIPGVV
ncbi:hypothetical protein JB92DRAFT_3037872 [Gautieria morchelliformis]|nr:hypothetical protein JB92DRAFT_3037872 [Gautieria morchelliformis]